MWKVADGDPDQAEGYEEPGRNVGAPAPGATHCSKMHNCVAPLRADTTMRVSTPGRQCSDSIAQGSLAFIELALSRR